MSENIQNTRNTALAHAWRNAFYCIWLGEHAIGLRVGVEPSWAAALAPYHSATIVTAWNPYGQNRDKAENIIAQRGLLEFVRQQNWLFALAEGASVDRVHVEPSLAVLGLTEAAACALGARFHQGAVVYWDGDVVRLLWMEAADA